MNKLNLTIIAMLFLINNGIGNAQTINWGNLKEEQTQIANLNTGLDYGLTLGAGYGYKLKTKMLIVVNVEYSFPSGEKIVDDFKAKLGGQIKLYQTGNFHFSAKVHSVFRRYENSLTSLFNFGSDMSATAGYYKPKWFVAGEIGFDKAITTHIKHSALMKENYSSIQDGWYIPTGGNFYYGFQTGHSFKRSDFTLKIGKVISQDFKTPPLFPFYVQLGGNVWF